MNSNDREKTQVKTNLHVMIKTDDQKSINDENNNFKPRLTSSSNEGEKSTEKDKENNNETTMLIRRHGSCSDEDLWDSSTSSSQNDKELISIDRTKLFNEISHAIKCFYRENSKESSGLSFDLNQIKHSIRMLTQLDAEWLFEQLEMIVVEFINEIRDEVLKRFQSCEKSSSDIQLFISYLLDEYHSFVQSAQNVSQLVSSLEENYLKKFHLTWLLYNKHLYEEFVYMDKKIHQSLSTMIDFLKPTNDQTDLNDYSLADFTQLLNRFLTFDEEMSEVACLYKSTQQKREQHRKNQSNRVVSGLPSNGSSIESGLDETREISSMSSVDEYLLEHQTSSTNLLEEQTNETKIAKSSRQKENSTLISDPLLTLSKGILGSDLRLPRKLQPDFRPLQMSSLLTNGDTTACPPFFPAKIQSASFTATTFGSITTTNQASRLNVNLRPKIPLSSPINPRNLEEILSQTNSTGLDLSSLISKNSKKCEVFSDSFCSESDDLPAFNPRLQLRLSKQTHVETNINKKTPKGKPLDENIDELVKYIDGEETTTTKESKPKKTKKKKGKQNRTNIESIIPSITTDDPLIESTKEDLPQENLPTRRPSTPSIQSTTDSPCRSLSPSEEEQINWITISRKATKQKAGATTTTTTTTASSTKATKQKRSTKNNPNPSQKTNPNPKPSINSKTTITKPLTAAQSQQPQKSVPKAQQPTSCWKKVSAATENLIPQGKQTKESPIVDSVKPKSTLVATAAAFIPVASRITTNPLTDVPLSRNEWDFSSYLLPSTFSSHSTLIQPPPPPPGPVQRPTGSFSSVSSNVCIQRPSSEPRTSPFPFCSSSIYTDENSQSIWTNNSSSNSNESLWPSSQEPPMRTSPTFDDFPLYDPFKSGTGLAIPPLSSSLPPGFESSFGQTNNPIGHHLHAKKDFHDLSFENDPSNYWEN